MIEMNVESKKKLNVMNVDGHGSYLKVVMTHILVINADMSTNQTI
jgi:hypothetical protein